jgi:GT2 family glycosyltransferase
MIQDAPAKARSATIEYSSIWIGLLDLDEDGPVVSISGEPETSARQARILIRMHHAPLGYVDVPVQPWQNFESRVRDRVKHNLAAALLQHARCDNALGPKDQKSWSEAVACPRNFAPRYESSISVVICTRNRADQLGTCLTALKQVTYDPIEFLIVDNAPMDTQTRDLVAKFTQEDSRFRYTCEPSPGLSAARNHGISLARFDLVAFTDDDTSVDRDWPTALIAGFAADAAVVCVTGLVVPSSLKSSAERYFDSRYSWGEAFDPRRYDMGDHRHPSRLYPFTAGMFGTGANFAVRRHTVTELGGFDCLLGAGSVSRGGEDLDMFLRLILAGGRICYLPSALVWHQHRSDTEALADQIYAYGHGLGAYLAKHLLNRNFSLSFLGGGLWGKVADTRSRMQKAATTSQLSSKSKKLALSEACGVAVGAFRYRRADSRRKEPDTR